MWCAPQLSHPSSLLGEKRQGERAFYQARVDRGVVEKNVDRSTVVVQEENHSIEVKRSYLTRSFWSIVVDKKLASPRSCYYRGTS